MTDDTLISIAIKENLLPGSLITHLSDLIIPRPTRNTDFTITKNDFFTIDGKDRLVVIGFIDRDDNPTLCSFKSINCSCIWKSFLLSSNGFHHILEIQITDENDNIPYWKPDSLVIDVTENTPPNKFQIELPKAIDLDEYPNDIVSYRIDPPSKHFEVISIKSLTGIKPILKLKKMIDRELISWLNITILATDGGNSSTTGSFFLFIQVLDVNDNAPVFGSSIYSQTIDNNYQLNTSIDLGIRATDFDVGFNGHVTYQFSLDVPFIIQTCFYIDYLTAVIRTKKLLIRECYSSKYQFTITASDRGQPKQTSKTSVILQLKNQNFYPPQIILSNNDPYINIFENNDSGSLLISGAVSDKDLDKNGQFICKLRYENSSDIILKINKTQIGDLTIISLLTNTSFDRERINRIKITIVCRDLGEPPLESIRNIFVNILDRNDNSPIFEKQNNYIQIYEENQPNFKIAQLLAHDMDSGENARLEYRIRWGTDKYDLRDLIAIDSKCQIIAKISLDREKYPLGFQFEIIATDNGEPQKTGSTSVSIELIDINDHSPIFQKPFYNISFIEDAGMKAKQRIVEFLIADDKDLMENGLITYSLLSDSLLPFKLHPNSGELYSSILVDRETQPTHYSFSVLATDNPSNLLYRKTTTASVSIIIDDFNDNEPIFIFPNEANHKVELSYLVSVGTLVTTVKAIDKDYGINSKIIYSLIDAERNILFALNETSGQLVISTVLTSMHEGIENLFIRASDCGSPRLTSIQRLTVIIREFKPPEANNEEDLNRDSFLSDQATFIIVGIILGTFFVCCGLVTGICTMAYRRWHSSHNRSPTTQLFQIGEDVNNVQYIDNYLIMKEMT